MSEQLSHSDLIYLFVDGEASTAERAKLYEAMAHDPVLQREFEDAMRMKAAVDREVTAALPPTSLTESLFMRAGVTLPVAASTAVAPAIPAIMNSGWFTVAKSFVLPALALMGAATYGVVKYVQSNEAPLSEPPAIVRSVEQSPASRQLLTQQAPQPVELPQATIAEQKQDLSISQNIPSSANSSLSHTATNGKATAHGSANGSDIVKNTEHTTTLHNTAIATPVDKRHNNSTTEILKSTEVKLPVVSIPMASVKSEDSKTADIRGGESANRSERSLTAMTDNFDYRPKNYISVGIEHQQSLGYFQSRTGGAPAPEFMKLIDKAVVGEFHMTDEWAAIGSIGDQSFSFFTRNDDGGFNSNTNMVWGGVGVHYTPRWLGEDVRPSFRTILGSSFAGNGFAKLGGGLQVYLSSSVTANLSAEVTEYMYSSNSKMLGTGKWNGIIGLSYNF